MQTRLCFHLCIIGLAQSASVAQNGANRTFDFVLPEDFAAGQQLNLRNVDGHLEVNAPRAMFPYVNMACTKRGTVVRIFIGSGTTNPYVMGEYQTFPSANREDDNATHGDPSRTTVDHLGNVWVANRGEQSVSGGVAKGAITRIALVEGGTRGKKIDGQFVPDPVPLPPEEVPGEYLSPPFTHVSTPDGDWHSLDKDGDNLLRTSSGLGSILAWPNEGGVDTDGGGRPENARGVLTAHDELIFNYTRVLGTKARTMAIDFDNNLWCGGYGNWTYQKISGVMGTPIPATQFTTSCSSANGGYGGLVDHFGQLWSVERYRWPGWEYPSAPGCLVWYDSSATLPSPTC